jgi:hypothetical protein
MEKLDARAYLISKGFTPGKRGRFSLEQIQALREAGYPVKDPKPRSKVSSTPLA